MILLGLMILLGSIVSSGDSQTTAVQSTHARPITRGSGSVLNSLVLTAVVCIFGFYVSSLGWGLCHPKG